MGKDQLFYFLRIRDLSAIDLRRWIKIKINFFIYLPACGKTSAKLQLLVPVDQAGVLFLSGRGGDEPGSAVCAVKNGSRTFLVEVQALVSTSRYGTPQRVVQGVDSKRVALLAAILEKRAGLDLGGCDIFVKVAGGGRVEDPGADLAIMAALASSLREKPVPLDTVIIGEVGLTGEVRQVSDTPSRLREAARHAGAATNAPGDWKPWFPVIDFGRCTNCMQCLTFCLFDVYGVDGKETISVQNQDNCKTDCPACSRVCPEAAILFPKYKAGPINGDVVRDEDLKRESMKVDISALLGGDIYGALRDRSKAARERFSTERDESKALLERKRCLKKLQKDLDIPNEVLMTLPSAGDIEDRTRRAKEKAERRKTRSQTMQDRKATPEEWGI